MNPSILGALEVAGDLIKIVDLVVDAVKSGDVERVDRILPAQMKITIAKQLADAQAAAKFEQ